MAAIEADYLVVGAGACAMASTHAGTEVPATHPPKYAVQPGVQCIPPNALPRVDRPYARYTVVGAGKTGMDACLWLVENGVPHDRIRWVMPRDPWVIDRATMQPGPDGWRRHFQTTLAQLDAICQAADVPDLYRRLAECGAWMRFDEGVEPTAYRCAIVSQAESEQLRLIADKVRLGRVRAIESGRMVLERGAVPAEPDTLYVDCSSGAIQPMPKVQVFDANTVNILMVRFCQPLLSASLIGWVEAHVADLQEQNALCRPVRGPELPIDFQRMWLPTMANAARWREHADLMDWLARCRLNGQAVVLRGVEITPEVKDLLRAVGQKAAQAAPKIPQLLGMAKPE